MHLKKKHITKRFVFGLLAILANFVQLYAQQKSPQLSWPDASHKASTDIKFICLLTFRDDKVELPIDFTTDTFLQNHFVNTWVKGYIYIPAPIRKKVLADSQYDWNVYLLSPSAKILKAIHGPAQADYIYTSLEDAQKDLANNNILFDELYRSGRRDTTFLKHFIVGDKITGSIPGDAILSSYCHALAGVGRTDTTLFPLIEKYVTDIQSEAYDYVLSRRKTFVLRYGQTAVDQYLGGTALISMNKEKISDKTLEKAMTAIKSIESSDLVLRLYLVDMKYYYRHKRADDIIKCMDTIISLHKPEIEYYEEVAYAISLVSHKPEHLRKAESYIIQSVNTDRTPLNTLIYAKILYAMGRTEDAQIFNLASQNLASAAHYKAGQTDRMLESCISKLK